MSSLPAVCFKTVRDTAKGEDRDDNRHQTLTPALCIAPQRSMSQRRACCQGNPILEELIFSRTSPAPSSYAWRGSSWFGATFCDQNSLPNTTLGGHKARGVLTSSRSPPRWLLSRAGLLQAEREVKGGRQRLQPPVCVPLGPTSPAAGPRPPGAR